MKIHLIFLNPLELRRWSAKGYGRWKLRRSSLSYSTVSKFRRDFWPTERYLLIDSSVLDVSSARQLQVSQEKLKGIIKQKLDEAVRGDSEELILRYPPVSPINFTGFAGCTFRWEWEKKVSRGTVITWGTYSPRVNSRSKFRWNFRCWEYSQAIVESVGPQLSSSTRRRQTNHLCGCNHQYLWESGKCYSWGTYTGNTKILR